MSQTKTVVGSAVALILLVAGTQSSRAGYCGPQQKRYSFFIPEYTCFSVAGGTMFSAACSAGRLAGYKPVYFGAACKMHDSCYAAKGSDKKQCDKAFRDLLYQTCDETLTGRYRTASREACHNLASTFYDTVRTRGGDSFNNAQQGALESDPQSAERGNEIPLRSNDLNPQGQITAQQLITLAGGHSNPSYIRNVAALSSELEDGTSVDNALAILGDLDGRDRDRVFQSLLGKLPDQITSQQLITLAGGHSNPSYIRNVAALSSELEDGTSVDNALAILGDLDGRDRDRVFQSLLGKLPDQITSQQLITLAGGHSDPSYIRNVAALSSNLEDGTSVDNALAILGDLDSRDRDRVFQSLLSKLPDQITAQQLITLAGGHSDPSYTRNVAALSSNLKDGTNVDDALAILGNLVGRDRDRAFQSLQNKLPDQITAR